MSKTKSVRNRRYPRRALIAVAVLAGLMFAAIFVGVRSAAQGAPPDFAMVAYQGEERLGGDELNFSELLGQGEPVVLNFWAALCPPCRQEMPGFQRIHDELGEEFTMLGVDIGPFIGLGSHDQAREFLDEYGIDYPTAYAVSDSPVRDYQVRGMPTTIFFDGNGAIAGKHTGYLTEERLREEIRALLVTTE
ncbi:MAG: TlpA disulfide reductase family protein [Trueperaceae bacterium]